MEQRLMPDCLDMREITFTNLLLLGFEPSVYEAKYKCPFNRDMFAFPNKKAMEAVFYFLFTKLNPDVARDEFRTCWPIYDKKQESAFRKVAAAWLNRISKEIHDSHVPRVVASVLLSPGGDKFYHLLFCFSSYVLREDLKKCARKGTILIPWPTSNAATKSLLPQMSKILRTKTACDTKRYLEDVRLSAAAQDEWVTYATELTKENRAIRKSKRDLEKSLKEVESEHLQRGLLSPATSGTNQQNSPYAGEVKSLKRTKIIQRVRDNWKRFNEVYKSQEHLRERIDEMMKGTSDKYCLKGSDIKITVPDVIIREYDEEIYQRRIANTYEGGKVNILSLVQLWNLSLRLLSEQFKSNPLPHLAKDEADVRQDLHNQSGYLQNIKSLKEILEKEMIPEIKDSIEDLKEMVYDQELKADQSTPKNMKKSDFSLTGLPATPSVHLTNESQPNDTQFTAFTKELFPNENTLTPEVVEKMMQSLRDMSLMKANESTVPDEKPAKTKSSSTKQRIPVLKPKSAVDKQTNKPKLVQSHDENFKKPRLPHATPLRKTASTKPSRDSNTSIVHEATPKVMKRNSPTKPLESAKKPAQKAQDILADKIVSAVMSQNASSSASSSGSSRCTTPQDHGLADPLASINEDAFHTKDKLSRTPLIKVRKEVNNKRSTTDALLSYLSVTSKDSISPRKPVRLFSESFTESPTLEKTPKQMFSNDFATNEDLLFASPFTTQQVVWNTAENDDTSTRVDNLTKEVRNIEMDSSNGLVAPKIPSNHDFLSTKIPSQASKDSIHLGNVTPLINDETSLLVTRNEQFESANRKAEEANGAEAKPSLDRQRFMDLLSDKKNTGTLSENAVTTRLRGVDSSETAKDLVSHLSDSTASISKQAPGSTRKNDLSDIINRFRILKSKSQKFDSSMRETFSDAEKVSKRGEAAINIADEKLGLSEAPKRDVKEGFGLFETRPNVTNIDLGPFQTPKKEAITKLGLPQSERSVSKVISEGVKNLGLFETRNVHIREDLIRLQTPINAASKNARPSPGLNTASRGLIDGKDASSRINGWEESHDSYVRDHMSLLEETRKSAEKDAVLWSDLKANISIDFDEFGDNELAQEPPVAKQLSFLQLDTRDLSRTPQNTDDSMQKSAEGTVHDDLFDRNDTPLSHVRHNYRHPNILSDTEKNAREIMLSDSLTRSRTEYGVNGRSHVVNKYSDMVEESRATSSRFANSNREVTPATLSSKSGFHNSDISRNRTVASKAFVTQGSHATSSESFATPDTIRPIAKTVATRTESELNSDLGMQSPQSLLEWKTPLNLQTMIRERQNGDNSFNLLTPGSSLRNGQWLLTDDQASFSLLNDVEDKDTPKAQTPENLIDLNW